MRIQRKDKRNFLLFLISILIVSVIGFYNKSFAMQDYQKLDFGTGLVTAKTLNVRCGPRNNLQSNF